MPEPTLTLREAAAATVAQIEAEKAAEHAAAQERQRQEKADGLRRALYLFRAYLPGETVPEVDGPEITLDGFRFGAVAYGGRSRLVLLGDCPRCGEATYSEPLSSLYELGLLARRFTPHGAHQEYCQPAGGARLAGPDAAAPAPSYTERVTERLVEALRDFVQMHGPEGHADA